MYFQGRTFVISCNGKDSIARLKANILHILYEMGRGSHQFRLKFKNQYLKDSATIEVCSIQILKIRFCMDNVDKSTMK